MEAATGPPTAACGSATMLPLRRAFDHDPPTFSPKLESQSLCSITVLLPGVSSSAQVGHSHNGTHQHTLSLPILGSGRLQPEVGCGGWKGVRDSGFMARGRGYNNHGLGGQTVDGVRPCGAEREVRGRLVTLLTKRSHTPITQRLG